jgi:hypothetical protein
MGIHGYLTVSTLNAARRRRDMNPGVQSEASNVTRQRTESEAKAAVLASCEPCIAARQRICFGADASGPKRSLHFGPPENVRLG